LVGAKKGCTEIVALETQGKINLGRTRYRWNNRASFLLLLFRSIHIVAGKAPASCPYVRCSHWTDFLEIWYWALVCQSGKIFQISILVNNQLYAQLFLSYIFVLGLYTFRAPLCSSSGESILLIRHLVYFNYVGDRLVCRFGWNWTSSIQTFIPEGHLHTVKYSRCPINLLKPTGYAMHHQFNVQQLYALSTLYLCVLYLSENKRRLVPLTA